MHGKVDLETMFQAKNISDFQRLLDLAKSRNIEVIEAVGLDERCGLRFRKSGKEYIAVNSNLPDNEKTRALGFLLEKEPGSSGIGLRKAETTLSEQSGYFCSLQCPTS